MNRERLKEFISSVKGKSVLAAEDLVEKDLYISALLGRVPEGYAFKGGTCLAKVYLEYHRISEDIDLTCFNQEAFRNKSTKQVKKICSEKAALFGRLLEDAAEEFGFDFRFQKSNRRYVELGSNSKLATFKVWYRSVVTGAETFIKVQITFLESLHYPVQEKGVLPLVEKGLFPEEEQVYFSEYMDLCRPLKLPVYDVREIAAEKVRALLTRRGIKTRDIVDVYCLEKAHNVSVARLKEVCIEKTLFAVRNYSKYRKNLHKTSVSDVPLENVEHLMIKKIGKKDFDVFAAKLFAFLEEVKAAVLLAEG